MAEDEKPIDPALLPPQPAAPDCMMEDDQVEATEFAYSDRAPTDWVISGPLGPGGHGKGNEFDTWEQAEKWARDKYKWRFRGRKPDEPGSHGRWAFVIKARGETTESN